MEIAETFVVFGEIGENFEKIFSWKEEKLGETYASISFWGLDTADEADYAKTVSLSHFADNRDLGIFIDEIFGVILDEYLCIV